MDGIQRLLAIVVVALTILLVIVGVQVILIILDLRKAIKKLNNLLEDAVLGGGLIRPDKLTGFVELFGKNKRMESRGQTELLDSSEKIRNEVAE